MVNDIVLEMVVWGGWLRPLFDLESNRAVGGGVDGGSGIKSRQTDSSNFYPTPLHRKRSMEFDMRGWVIGRRSPSCQLIAEKS